MYINQFLNHLINFAKVKKIHDINIYIMKWIDGLKEFNKNKKYKNWVVPRKGTYSYKEVMEMIKDIDEDQSGEITFEEFITLMTTQIIEETVVEEPVVVEKMVVKNHKKNKGAATWKTLPLQQSSSDFLWELTRDYSSYLVKSQGAVFSRDPLNLTGLNTKRDSGIVNSSAIGLGLASVNKKVKEKKEKKAKKQASVVRVNLRIKTKRQLPKKRLVQLKSEPTSNNLVYGEARGLTLRAVVKALNRNYAKSYRQDLLAVAFRRLRRINKFKKNNKRLNKQDAKKVKA